jgi:RecB family exonuclease
VTPLIATDPRILLEAIQAGAAQALASLPAESDAADVLSASQVRTYLDCPARWGYKYITGLPDPKGGSLVRGIVVHRIQELYYRLRMAGATVEDLDTLGDPFEAAWEETCENASFAADEKPDELKRQAATLIRMYLEDVGPEIEPSTVETPVSGTIGGVPVRGVIDLVDVAGTIHDTKTAARKPSSIAPDYAFQAATYCQLEPRASGLVQLTTLVATKTPTIVKMQYQVSDADIRMTQAIYPAVQAAMKDGRCLPSRGSNLCSRKHCNFWAQCEKDWGGRVKGAVEE